MRRALLLLVVVVATGCSRDLTTPPLPAPGQISGRVVYATPGRSDLKPAAAAAVSLMGSGLSATTNQAGTFSLAPVNDTEGLLHFTFDSDGDGVVDRQRVEQLSEWKSGLNRQVAMGDIALGENAAVSGKVLLADRPGARSGLRGTAVFVPEGPFATYTADDGSFALPNLPQGPLQFYLFRQGYAAKSIGSVSLRAGEDYTFRDLVLSVSTDPPGPGSVLGRLAFSPSSIGKGDTAISAQAALGPAIEGAVGDDLSFRFDLLPQGLYTLTATRTNFTRARVFNVLVLPQKESDVGLVLITTQPESDGGRLSVSDDGGAPCIGAQCQACSSNAHCSNTEWCDNFYCAPQCSALIPCSNGRACDSTTKTCVTRCGSGCPNGQICQSDICRSACDGSFMCGAGFKCAVGNVCIPECATDPDCGQQHLACVAGQCVSKDSCTNDLDCSVDKMCLVTTCLPRLTARSDGGQGPFVCSTACNCRLGEWCTGGLCLPDVLPTLFFATDADGGGTTMDAPSSQLRLRLDAAKGQQVLALRRGDRFYEAGGFGLSSNVTLAGGFEVCATNRWVRSDTGRTTLAADAGNVLRAIGTALVPVDDVRVRNVSLETAADYRCTDFVFEGANTRRLEVSRVEGALLATNDCADGGTNALIHCTDCQEALIADVVLKPSAARSNSVIAVEFVRSDGTVRRLSSEKQGVVHSYFALFRTYDQSGPILVQGCVAPETSNSLASFGVSAEACGGKSIIVERSTFGWGRSTLNQGSFAGVSGINCTQMEVRDNLFDGTASVTTLNPISSAVRLESSGGTIERNLIKLPRTSSATELAGVAIHAADNVTTVRDNTILGGDSTRTVDGIHIENTIVPTVLSTNEINVGPSQTVNGIIGKGNSGGLRISDNFIRATGNKGCGSKAFASTHDSTPAVIERNRFLASGAAKTRALESEFSALELYSNHFWVGSAECTGDSISVKVGNSSVYASGNTLDIEADPTTTGTSTGMFCAFTTVFKDENVIGSGRGMTRRLLTTAGAL